MRVSKETHKYAWKSREGLMLGLVVHCGQTDYVNLNDTWQALAIG